MEIIKEIKKNNYDNVVKYFLSVRQQNVRLQHTINDLRKRVEFIESLTLNIPEFNIAFERMNENHNTDLSKLNDIVKIVCEYYNINPSILLRSKSRKREYVDLRQILHYFCKKYTDLSLNNIGLTIGNMNHSTVLHSYKIVNDRLTYDKKLIKDIDKLETKIKELEL